MLGTVGVGNKAGRERTGRLEAGPGVSAGNNFWNGDGRETLGSLVNECRWLKETGVKQGTGGVESN